MKDGIKMKQEFINFVNALMESSPELTEKLMTDDIKNYLMALSEAEESKSEITDNGKIILKHLQSVEVKPYKSKDIANEIYMSSGAVSGSLRKLVNDQFVEKIGKDPTFYTITEKGKNYKIED